MLEENPLEGDQPNSKRDEEESEMSSQDGCPLLDPLQGDHSARQHAKHKQHAHEVPGQAQGERLRQQVAHEVNQGQQPHLHGDDQQLAHKSQKSPPPDGLRILDELGRSQGKCGQG